MELDYIFGYISECLTKNDRICFPLQPGSDSAYRSCVLELIRLFAEKKNENDFFLGTQPWSPRATVKNLPNVIIILSKGE